MSLEGKVCIVTGASSGIGEEIAVLFAERKGSVVLCGRSETRLEKCLKRCQDVSPENGDDKDRFIIVKGDLTDPLARTEIVQKTVEKFGRIDVLIANAGVLSVPVPILDTTEDMYDDVMGVNVKSSFFLIKEAVPWLEKTRGNVVCISSIGAHVAAAATLYCMSKATIDHMCRCLATDLGPKGIRVNTINPTFVKTRLMRSFIPNLAESTDLAPVDAMYDSKGSIHPLSGRVATVEDVARATAFVASEEASFITGQSLDVDGGVSKMCFAFHAK